MKMCVGLYEAMKIMFILNSARLHSQLEHVWAYFASFPLLTIWDNWAASMRVTLIVLCHHHYCWSEMVARHSNNSLFCCRFQLMQMMSSLHLKSCLWLAKWWRWACLCCLYHSLMLHRLQWEINVHEDEDRVQAGRVLVHRAQHGHRFCLWKDCSLYFSIFTFRICLFLNYFWMKNRKQIKPPVFVGGGGRAENTQKVNRTWQKHSTAPIWWSLLIEDVILADKVGYVHSASLLCACTVCLTTGAQRAVLMFSRWKLHCILNPCMSLLCLVTGI